MASAAPEMDAFPDIPFKVFSDFVEGQFSSKVSLATVLTALFSLTENPDLLNLHARQQHPRSSGERRVSVSGWMKALARALEKRLGGKKDTLLRPSEIHPQMSQDVATTSIAIKLDGLAKILDLHPYDKRGRFTKKLNPVSLTQIEPALVICPEAMECMTESCQSRALLLASRERDISHATVIKGSTVHHMVQVLGGHCPVCHTRYHADHETALTQGNRNSQTRLYLNTAKYLKVGKKTWVDRPFSSMVLNGIYNFHASAAAYAEWWNDTFRKEYRQTKMTRRIIWQAFIQESI
jgi:hypothetical protein